MSGAEVCPTYLPTLAAKGLRTGHHHSLEVMAETLYEAVAQVLALFKSDEWVGQIGEGLT